MTEHIEAFEEVYRIEQRIRLLEADIAEAKAERDQIVDGIVSEDGPGAACLIHGGSTLAYLNAGRRAVDKQAVGKHQEALPPNLRPRLVEQMKWPTAKDIDDVAALLRAQGVDPEDLFQRATPKPQFREADKEDA